MIKLTEKFGMIEVFLGALAIFAGKLSANFEVDWQFGLVVFFMAVVLNLLATLNFRPRIFRYRFKDKEQYS